MPFVIWMFMWPVSQSVCNYLSFKIGLWTLEDYAKLSFIYSVYVVGVWIFVGIKLWGATI